METICPICFAKFNPRRIGITCSGCGENTMYSKLKRGLFSGGSTFRCPSCGRFLSDFECPVCGRSVPISTLDCEPVFFSIIGARGSGKSHYIAQIVKTLRRVSRGKFEFLPADKFTQEIYHQKYESDLFEKLRPLPATNRWINAQEIPRPLIYTLSFKNFFRTKKCMLVIYDAAGEDLQNADVNMLRNGYPYIGQSSGIILLVDPLSMPMIRNSQLMEEYFNRVGNELLSSYSAGQILKKIRTILGSKCKTIPLAITFSKIDAVRKFFGEEASIFISPNCNPFDKTRQMQINSDIVKWLERYQGKDNILAEGRHFKKHSYFGVSALGDSLSRSNDGLHLNASPVPFGVEGPLLYLLKERHYL